MFGIATYHSTMPYYNYRYQILLSNALVKAGVIQGIARPVPPLHPPGGPRTFGTRHACPLRGWWHTPSQ
jgi:hypothetical protein